MGIPQRALALLWNRLSVSDLQVNFFGDFTDSRNQDVDFFLEQASSRNSGAIQPVKW